MTTFDKPKANIHLISRGLLLQNGNVILCRTKGAGWYFLPGGHIENGEVAKQALKRELEEELNISGCDVGEFVGVCENTFELSEGVLQQELNLVFKVELPQNITVTSQEDHIEFISVSKNDLSNYNLLPVGVKQGIISWLDKGVVFSF